MEVRIRVRMGSCGARHRRIRERAARDRPERSNDRRQLSRRKIPAAPSGGEDLFPGRRHDLFPARSISVRRHPACAEFNPPIQGRHRRTLRFRGDCRLRVDGAASQYAARLRTSAFLRPKRLRRSAHLQPLPVIRGSSRLRGGSCSRRDDQLSGGRRVSRDPRLPAVRPRLSP